MQIHDKSKVQQFEVDYGNYDHLFTPEVLAAIDKGTREVEEGKSLSREEVNAYIAEVRAEWIKNHPN